MIFFEIQNLVLLVLNIPRWGLGDTRYFHNFI